MCSFLDTHYDKYYNDLSAHENEQLFIDYLDYLINLAKTHKSGFSLKAYDEVQDWITIHRKPTAENDKDNHLTNHSLPIKDLSDVPSELPRTMRHIALWYTYQGITFRPSSSRDRSILKQLASKYGFTS